MQNIVRVKRDSNGHIMDVEIDMSNSEDIPLKEIEKYLEELKKSNDNLSE